MAKWNVIKAENIRGEFPEFHVTLATAETAPMQDLLDELEAGGKWNAKFWAAYRATMAGVLFQMETLADKLEFPMTADERRQIEVDIHGWFGLDAEGREAK